MPSRRIALVPELEKLPRPLARWILASIAEDTVHSIRTRRMAISRAEDIVFNLDVLSFCRGKLRDKNLRWIIEYGMELSDLDRLVGKPSELVKACTEIEERLRDYTASMYTSGDTPPKMIRALTRKVYAATG